MFYSFKILLFHPSLPSFPLLRLFLPPFPLSSSLSPFLHPPIRHVEISLKDAKPPTCPDPECQYAISAQEIEQIFGKGPIYDKFNEIVLRQAVQTMDGSIGCPTPGCSNWIVADTRSKVRCACPGCKFVFCSVCRERYHYGPYSYADVKGLEVAWMQWNLRDRKQILSREQEEVVKLRKQELKKRMEDLKRDEDWKEQNLKLCPNCSRAIEKTGGCDSMVCGRDTDGGANVQDGCGHHFSWSSAHPYKKAKWDDHLKKVDQTKITEDELIKVRRDHGVWNCDCCANKILGIRFECVHCPSYSICQDCETKGTSHHPQEHVFRIIEEE